MANPLRNLKDRPTLQSTLAAFVASALALGAILLFGGDEPTDRKVVDDLCARGLEQLAEQGGLDLCTHGPDPKRAFKTAASTSPTSVNLYYRQSLMCPGDGKSGPRVYVYVGSPVDQSAPPATFTSLVKQTLGLAERQMRQSHPTHAQKINYYCETDRTPTIRYVTFPAIGSDGEFTFDDMLETIGDTNEPGAHVAFPYGIDSAYPYCGEGTVGGFDDPATDVHFSLIGCLAPSDTLLHELGHNLGAVRPEAPNDSGAWHGTDQNDVMSYNDGGSYYASGGQLQTRCGKLTWNGHQLDVFDCGFNDFWSPVGDFPWVNTSDNPLLTPPRKK